MEHHKTTDDSRRGSSSAADNESVEDDKTRAKTTMLPSTTPKKPPPRPPKVAVAESDVLSANRSTMLVISTDQLREIMRQEIANVLGPAPPHVGNRSTAASPPSLLASLSSSVETSLINGKRPAQTASPPRLSVSDEKWGALFDETGKPKKRAEDMLQSIADHIVLEYEPRQSIVVTPDKLARFYDQHRLPREVYPFTKIFDASTATSFVHDRIADLYDDLGCQYHLIQKNARSRPTVPALTPKGFAQWLLVNLQAYPNEESQRLSGVVLAMPVNITNTYDGKTERMPRIISRHTLPRHPDNNARKLLDEALDDFIEETVPVSPCTPAHLELSTAPSLKTVSSSSPEASPVSSMLKYTPKYMHPGQEIVGTPASSPTGLRAAPYWACQSHADERKYARHHSLPVGSTSQQVQLPPPGPVGTTRQRSLDPRRYSHSAVTITQEKSPAGGPEQAPSLTDTGSILSIPQIYIPSLTEAALPNLSPAQLATIRYRSPRRGRDKEYYNASKQMTYSPAPSDVRGGPTWDEYLRQRET